MSKLTLNHEHTPPELQTINTELVSLLSSEELDEARLLQLVEQRDEVVTNLLQSLDKNNLQAFAELELQSNERLVGLANELLSSSLQQATSLVRGLKAIKNYQT